MFSLHYLLPLSVLLRLLLSLLPAPRCRYCPLHYRCCHRWYTVAAPRCHRCSSTARYTIAAPSLLAVRSLLRYTLAAPPLIADRSLRALCSSIARCTLAALPLLAVRSLLFH